MEKIFHLLFTCMILTTSIKAQDTVKHERSQISFSIGGGISSAPSQHDEYGEGIMFALTVQKKSNTYNFTARRIQEPEGDVQHPRNSNNCIDITYGKIFKGFFSVGFHAGISFIEGTRQERHVEGGGLFGPYIVYEQSKFHTIGFPLSVKILRLLKKNKDPYSKSGIGLGIEIFSNLNREKSFYGLNIFFHADFRSGRHN